MSLIVSRGDKELHIKYVDEERSTDVVIDLERKNVVIYSSKNMRVIVEDLTSETQKQARRRLKEERATLTKASKTKILNKEFKEELKEEVYEILSKHQTGLTLDDILEIAQYEKSRYHALNKLIHLAGSAYSAKRYLALVVGALRKEGRIVKREELTITGSVVKYYILGTNVR